MLNAAPTFRRFSAVKKLFFKLALVMHPDKGGKEEDFRSLQEAW